MTWEMYIVTNEDGTLFLSDPNHEGDWMADLDIRYAELFKTEMDAKHEVVFVTAFHSTFDPTVKTLNVVKKVTLHME